MGVQAWHRGYLYLRKSLDTFTVQGPNGEHHCLVHEPMLEDTTQLLCRNPSHRFTEDLLRVFIRCLLLALDYLHTEAHLIHTGKSLIEYKIRGSLVIDISARNILMGIRDKSVIRSFIKAEQEHPSPRKEMEGYTVYASRMFYSPSSSSIGAPVLCGFGSAVFGNIEHDEDVQPDLYRAPEVCLIVPWSYSIDIWSVGCLVCLFIHKSSDE